MTRRGCHPLESRVLKRIRLLMQIHLLTNPERIGRDHGVSAEYVRRQWRDMPMGEFGTLANKLSKIIED